MVKYHRTLLAALRRRRPDVEWAIETGPGHAGVTADGRLVNVVATTPSDDRTLLNDTTKTLRRMRASNS